jgi:hypothetical protein
MRHMRRASHPRLLLTLAAAALIAGLMLEILDDVGVVHAIALTVIVAGLVIVAGVAPGVMTRDDDAEGVRQPRRRP